MVGAKLLLKGGKYLCFAEVVFSLRCYCNIRAFGELFSRYDSRRINKIRRSTTVAAEGKHTNRIGYRLAIVVVAVRNPPIRFVVNEEIIDGLLA